MDRGERKELKEESDRGAAVEEEAAAVADAVAALVVSPKQPPDIFKLNVDCFEDAFDYLTMQDLISVGKTCKRLHNVAGHCFRQTYTDFSAFISCTGIVNGYNGVWTDATHFAKCIKSIWISDRLPNGVLSMSAMSIFLKILPELHRLKKLLIEHKKVYPVMVEDMKESLGKLEIVSLNKCNLIVNVSDIIDHCTNIRILYLHMCEMDYNWLNRQYPTLQHLYLCPCKPEPIEEIAPFLQMNPNIRKFVTSCEFLWANRDALKNAINIELRELGLKLSVSFKEFGPLCSLLDELHERGFYQRLHLQIRDTFKPEQIVNIKGFVKLAYHGFSLALSTLKNLVEVGLNKEARIADAESAALNLVNLKRIYFEKVSINDITPFIKRSAQLRTIIAANLEDGIYFNERTKIIDLVALNRERQKLPDAQKITFHVKEFVYLATKWALIDTNMELIRLKRFVYYDWDEIFD